MASSEIKEYIRAQATKFVDNLNLASRLGYYEKVRAKKIPESQVAAVARKAAIDVFTRRFTTDLQMLAYANYPVDVVENKIEDFRNRFNIETSDRALGIMVKNTSFFFIAPQKREEITALISKRLDIKNFGEEEVNAFKRAYCLSPDTINSAINTLMEIGATAADIKRAPLSIICPVSSIKIKWQTAVAFGISDYFMAMEAYKNIQQTDSSRTQIHMQNLHKTYARINYLNDLEKEFLKHGYAPLHKTGAKYFYEREKFDSYISAQISERNLTNKITNILNEKQMLAKYPINLDDIRQRYESACQIYPNLPKITLTNTEISEILNNKIDEDEREKSLDAAVSKIKEIFNVDESTALAYLKREPSLSNRSAEEWVKNKAATCLAFNITPEELESQYRFHRKLATKSLPTLILMRKQIADAIGIAEIHKEGEDTSIPVFNDYIGSNLGIFDNSSERTIANITAAKELGYSQDYILSNLKGMASSCPNIRERYMILALLQKEYEAAPKRYSVALKTERSFTDQLFAGASRLSIQSLYARRCAYHELGVPINKQLMASEREFIESLTGKLAKQGNIIEPFTIKELEEKYPITEEALCEMYAEYDNLQKNAAKEGLNLPQIKKTISDTTILPRDSSNKTADEVGYVNERVGGEVK